MTFYRILFWHKCQEMQLRMRILMHCQDLNCNLGLLDNRYTGSLNHFETFLLHTNISEFARLHTMKSIAQEGKSLPL